jgi:aspartate carbamoyltransferase regulatory subunit
MQPGSFKTMTIADSELPKDKGKGMHRIFGTRRCTDPECIGQMMLKGIRKSKKSAPKTEQLWICKVCDREEWETQDIGLEMTDGV